MPNTRKNSRQVGYHDHNCPSGLSPAILWARGGGIKMVPYDTLPSKDNQDIPETFIINPICAFNNANEYWANIRACIESHPQTKFTMFMPDSQEREDAQRVLGGLNGVTYVGGREIDKLASILQGTF